MYMSRRRLTVVDCHHEFELLIISESRDGDVVLSNQWLQCIHCGCIGAII